MKSSKESIEAMLREQLIYIGENPDREGLKGTPERVVRMWKEIFRGYDPKQKPKITTFSNGLDGVSYDQMVTDTGDYFSHCEHHMVPFFGQYYFGYIPSENGHVLGLSKVARIVDYYSAKLQIQERLVNDIVKELWNALCLDRTSPVGMGLVMKGEHLCKTMRGAKKKGLMTTSKFKGIFLDNPEVRSEFLTFIK